MGDKVQLSGEMATRVEEVLQSGADRLTDLARVVGGQADAVAYAYTGGGREQMEQNYRDLQTTGLRIAAVLGRMGDDFNVTVNTGMGMQEEVSGQMARAADGGGAAIDPSVARAV